MALSYEDTQGTIPAYYTPEQKTANREYSKALLYGAGQQPVKHWTQGLSNMVAALVGGNEAYRTDRQDMRSQADVGRLTPLNPLAADAKSGIGVTPPVPVPPGGVSSNEGTSLDDVYLKAVAKIESGGNPRNVTGSNRGLMQFGPEEERKYGITNWRDPDQQAAALQKERADHHARLVKALGRAPTPSELYLTHQQGPAGGPALLAGDPNEPAWRAIRPYYKSDHMAQLAITGNIPSDSPLKHVPVDRITKSTFAALWDAKYNRFAGKAGGGNAPASPSAGSAMAFAGTPATPGGGPDDATSGWLRGLDAGVAPAATATPDSPENMASALTQVAGAKPAPGTAPMGPGAPAPRVPEGAIPQRPVITRPQIEMLMANPGVSPELKAMYMQMYMQQGQPQSVPVLGGTVTVDRHGKQFFVPTLHDEDFKAGSVSGKQQSIIVPGPDGRPVKRIIEEEGTTPSVGGVKAAPAPSATPDDIGTVPSLGKGSLGKALKYAPEEGDQGGPTPGLQTQNATPGQVLSDAAPIGGPGDKLALNAPAPDAVPGMLGTRPPVVPPPEQTTPVQTAQLSPSIVRKWDQANEIEREQEARKELDKKDIDALQKNVDTTNEMGNKASTMTTQLEIARNMIENPKFKNGQGIFADPWLTMNRFKAAMGGDPEAASLAQAFDKVTSSNILRDLGVELKGTGQVRVAEIELLKIAAASRYNTVAANRAVLDIAIRAHKQVEQLQQLTNAYMKGIRFDKSGDPITDKNGKYIISGERPTDRGLQLIKQQYLATNPLYDKDEVKDYMHIFKEDPKYAQGEVKQGKGLLAKPRPPEVPPETAPTRPPPAGYR